MSDRLVMVCVGVEEIKNPVEGSMIARCMECGVGVWISPASLAVQPTAEPICLSCATDILLAPDHEIIPPSPAQIEELKKEMSKREN